MLKRCETSTNPMCEFWDVSFSLVQFLVFRGDKFEWFRTLGQFWPVIM